MGWRRAVARPSHPTGGKARSRGERPASGQDQTDRVQGGQVGQRIAVHDEEVGVVAGGEMAAQEEIFLKMSSSTR